MRDAVCCQLSGLKKDPKNITQALGFIPRTMRMM